MTMIDRSEVSRQLAKAIAYKQCGKAALQFNASETLASIDEKDS